MRRRAATRPAPSRAIASILVPPTSIPIRIFIVNLRSAGAANTRSPGCCGGPWGRDAPTARAWGGTSARDRRGVEERRSGSEHQLHTELDVAVAVLARHATEAAAARIAGHRAEVRMVEDVEGLEAELQAMPARVEAHV